MTTTAINVLVIKVTREGGSRKNLSGATLGGANLTKTSQNESTNSKGKRIKNSNSEGGSSKNHNGATRGGANLTKALQLDETVEYRQYNNNKERRHTKVDEKVFYKRQLENPLTKGSKTLSARQKAALRAIQLQTVESNPGPQHVEERYHTAVAIAVPCRGPEEIIRLVSQIASLRFPVVANAFAHTHGLWVVYFECGDRAVAALTTPRHYMEYKAVKDSHIRDLTRYGVESNPGPNQAGNALIETERLAAYWVEMLGQQATRMTLTVNSTGDILRVTIIQTLIDEDRESSVVDISFRDFLTIAVENRVILKHTLLLIQMHILDVPSSWLLECFNSTPARAWIRDLTREGVEPNPGPKPGDEETKHDSEDESATMAKFVSWSEANERTHSDDEWEGAKAPRKPLVLESSARKSNAFHLSDINIRPSSTREQRLMKAREKKDKQHDEQQERLCNRVDQRAWEFRTLNLRCKICKTKGHVAHECPGKSKTPIEDSKRCRLCRKDGHIAKQCPTFKDNKGSKKKSAVGKFVKFVRHSMTGKSVNAALGQLPFMPEPTQPAKKSLIADGDSDGMLFDPAANKAIRDRNKQQAKAQRAAANASKIGGKLKCTEISGTVHDAEDAEFSEEDSEEDEGDKEKEPKASKVVLRESKKMERLKVKQLELQPGDVLRLELMLLHVIIVTLMFLYHPRLWRWGVFAQSLLMYYNRALLQRMTAYLCFPQLTGEMHADTVTVDDTVIPIFHDMADKAASRYYTRSLVDKAEESSVKRDLIPMARSAKLHTLINQDTSLDIIDRAHMCGKNNALKIRLLRARTNSLKAAGFAAWFRMGLAFGPFWSPRFKTVEEELTYLELNLPVELGYCFTKVFGYGAGLAARSLFIPLVEESLRWMLIRTFAKMFRSVVAAPSVGEWIAMGFILVLSALMAIKESKGGLTVGNVFRGFVRMALHTVISKVNFFTRQLAFHVAWNMTSRIMGFSAELDVFDDFFSPHSRVYADVCAREEGLGMPEQQSGLKVERGDLKCEPQLGAKKFWGFSFAVPTVFRACSCNEEISMAGRVGKKLPQHATPEVAASVIQRWKQAKSSSGVVLKRKIKCVRKPVNLFKWLATYPPKRRQDFARAIEMDREFTPCRASSFVKREIAPKITHSAKFKDPRFIQGCPVELSLLAGPYLRKLAKETRQGLNGGACDGSWVTTEGIKAGDQIGYTCGLSANDIGSMYAQAIEAVGELGGPDNVVIIEDDQSRFDLHITQGPFDFLNDFYKTKLPRKVASGLKRGLSAGSTSFGTKYSLPYTMQSGWPDTSIGDTLVNAAMKIEIHGSRRNWFSIICGDDSVTITTRQELERMGGVERMQEQYSEFGMEVTIGYQTDPLLVEFCSGRFYPLLNGSYVLMPKTARFLSKIMCDMEQRTEKIRKMWYQSIIATLCNYGLVDPLIAALARAMKRNIPHEKRSPTESKKVGNARAKLAYATEHVAKVSHRVEADFFQYYSTVYNMSRADVEICIAILETQQLGNCVGELCFEQMLETDLTSLPSLA